jgi:hypothetical protein
MFLQNVGMSPYDVTTQKINIEMTSTELVSWRKMSGNYIDPRTRQSNTLPALGHAAKVISSAYYRPEINK